MIRDHIMRYMNSILRCLFSLIAESNKQSGLRIQDAFPFSSASESGGRIVLYKD